MRLIFTILLAITGAVVMARPDLPYVVSSALLPLRVSYEDPNKEALAVAVLKYTETTWRLFNDWGFLSPPINPDIGHYQIFVEPLSGASGTTEFDGVNPATNWNDCYSYVRINSNKSPDEVTVIAHEFVHVAQKSIDCLQPVFVEAIATYLQTVAEPKRWRILVDNAPAFQSAPWRSLDDQTYKYGAGLWIYYLASKYAQEDSPGFIEHIWRTGMQPEGSTVASNIYDSIEQTLAKWGGPSFDEAFIDFCESRFFVGTKDDGAHMSRASEFAGGEIVPLKQFTAGELPVLDWSPPIDKRPAAYGSNHLVLTLQPDLHSIHIVFKGDSTTRWGVRVVVFENSPTRSFELPLSSANEASIDIELRGERQLLLAVANLGSESYSPCVGDKCSWPTASYSIHLSASEFSR